MNTDWLLKAQWAEQVWVQSEDLAACFKDTVKFFLWSHVTSPPRYNVITPAGSWPRHWAGSEVGALTGWGPAGPQPDSAPHPRSLHGNAASARRHHNSPCRHATSPGRYWEGCWRCRTSAASGQVEWRNSAEEKRELTLNNLRSLTSFCAGLYTIFYILYQRYVGGSTWAPFCPGGIGSVSGLMTASPLIITLSCSDGHEANCWSSSAERTPEPMTERIIHTLTRIFWEKS